MLDYRNPSELARWLDNWSALVIPQTFAEGASPAEITALGARQIVKARSPFLLLAIPPVGITLFLLERAQVQSRPEIAALVVIASLVAIVWIFHWTMRYQDRRLDQAAIALTKNPVSYIQAVDRAAQTLPWTPTYPLWFKRDSIESRSAAIRGIRSF